MKIDLIWNAIAVLIAKSGIFILTVIAFNLLNLSLFAEFGVMILIYSTFVGVFGQAILMTANKYTSEQVSLRNFKIIIALIMFFLLLTLSPLLYYHYGFTIISVYFLSAGMFFNVMFSINIGMLFGLGNNKAQSILYSIQVLSLIVLGYFSLVYQSIDGIAISFALSTFFGYMASLRYLPMTIESNNIDILSILKDVTIPLVIAGMASSIVFLVVIELIKDGGNYEHEMALFTVANQLRMVIATIPVLFGSVLLRVLVKKSKDKKTDYVNYYIAVIPSLFFICVVDILWQYWDLFESQPYSQMYLVSLLFLIGTAIAAFKSGIGRNIIVSGLGKISIYSNISWSMFFLGFSYLGYYYGYGLNSIAVAFIVSHIVHYIFWRVVFKKYNVLKISEKDIVIVSFFIILGLLLLNIIYTKFYLASTILLAIFIVISYKRIRRINVSK